MTTYSDMYLRIGDEIQDASLTTQVQRAIQDAIAIYEPTRFYFNQAIGTFNTVANQEYYGAAAFADIPLLIEIDYMKVIINGVRISLYSEDAIDMGYAQNGSAIGPPRTYAYYAQQIKFFPIPDQVYPISMGYHHRLTPLAAPIDTNAWMTDGEMLIRQTAKSLLAIDVLQEPNITQMAQLGAKMALDRLQMETRRRRSNPLLKTDIPSGAASGDVYSGETW